MPGATWTQHNPGRAAGSGHRRVCIELCAVVVCLVVGLCAPRDWALLGIAVALWRLADHTWKLDVDRSSN